MEIKFSRFWAMPSSDTFDVPPISEFVRKYLRESKISIDPFARNTRWATYTNDLNPETHAEYHMEALDFLAMLKEKKVLADLVIFDPPYSPRQIAECYKGIGKKTTQQDTQNSTWANWKKAINPLVKDGGIVLTFGWNTTGMGLWQNYSIKEIMLICHGGQHCDTICVAEIKGETPPTLF